jgi:Na+/melibiose symporter-like transporter
MSMQVKKWYSWFKESQFYLYGAVYTMVRMAVNVNMTLQGIYLRKVLDFRPETEPGTPLAVALTPLVSYTASLLFQIFVYKWMLIKLKNRFLPMLIAIFVTAAGCVPLIFLNPNNRNLVYLCFPIVQIGMAIMINTSTSLISDVIGKDADSSAFVYGCYSFLDKIANGIAIERSLALLHDNAFGMSMMIGCLPLGCSLIAFILTYIGKISYSEK